MAKEKKKTPALPEADENTPAPKKSNKKRIVIIILLLLFTLSGAAAGGYWWFFMRNPGMISLTEGQDEGQQTEAKQENQEKPSASAKPTADGVDPQARLDRPQPLPRSNGVVVPLPMVTVNLYESGGHRYLKLGMEVEASKDISSAIKANEARIRDAVIMLLAGKTYAEIASPDGKVMLKAEVANRLNQILGEQRIIRIYFTDFVVQ